MNDVLKHQLHRAQQRMKHFADKRRSEKEFAVGDQVYLRLQPYIQTYVAQQGNHKWSYRFFGPFTIVAKVGVVANKLNLPEDSKIHPVVHVSQLKKHVPAEAVVDERVDQLPSDPMEIVCPVKLIAARMIKRGSSTLHQIQV